MLRRALARVRRVDANRLAQRAFDYLPPGAAITATIYPVIKPARNSFVFEKNAMYCPGGSSS